MQTRLSPKPFSKLRRSKDAGGEMDNSFGREIERGAGFEGRRIKDPDYVIGKA